MRNAKLLRSKDLFNESFMLKIKNAVICFVVVVIVATLGVLIFGYGFTLILAVAYIGYTYKKKALKKGFKLKLFIPRDVVEEKQKSNILLSEEESKEQVTAVVMQKASEIDEVVDVGGVARQEIIVFELISPECRPPFLVVKKIRPKEQGDDLLKPNKLLGSG